MKQNHPSLTLSQLAKLTPALRYNLPSVLSGCQSAPIYRQSAPTHCHSDGYSGLKDGSLGLTDSYSGVTDSLTTFREHNLRLRVQLGSVSFLTAISPFIDKLIETASFVVTKLGVFQS